MRPRREERGQAVQIGAVLLFGFLVLALSGYQAVTVPQQNAAVEANHDDRVARDMVSLRDAVVSAANAGETGAVGVQLGTRYPARPLAVNPSPPTGRLATTPPDGLSVTGNVSLDCAGAETTRFVEYTPSYNEYRNAPTRRYEHTLLYADFGAAVLPATGQRLFLAGNDDGVIGDGDIVNVVPVRNAFNRTGSDAVSVDVVEGETVRTVVQGPTVTLPTRLSVTNWSAVLPAFEGGTTVSVGDPDSDGLDELTVDFPNSASMTVYCTPVGIGGAPPSGAADLASPSDGGGGGGGGAPTPTPTPGGGGTSADAVSLSSSSSFNNGGGPERQGMEFTLSNGGSGAATITDISVDATTSPANKVRLPGGAEFERTDGAGTLDQEMDIDGTTYGLGTDATISGGGSATFELKNLQQTGGGPPSNVDMRGESLTITVYYGDGSSEQFTLTG